MIYTLTRSIVKLALHGFYHDIKVIGKENLEEKVPTIFISNHPSALMDPLVVSTSIGRKFHFIAAAEYFGKGFKNWLLQHEFNMIPVYRPNFYEGQKVDNTDMFRECYKALDKNGSIIIYPEGTSVSAHNIRSLKTGVMRIAKGFKKAHPSRKIFVQSIGVNYSHLQQFQSAVIIKIGKPIEIDIIDEEAKSIASWTSKLQEDMKEQVLHVEDPELIEVVNMINWVFLKKLETRLEINQNNEEDRFRIRKNVIRAIEHFHSQDSSKLADISQRLSRLIEKSRSLKIPEFAFHRKWHLKDVFLLLIGFPFFSLGLILNGGPYMLVRSLFRKKYLPNVKFDDSEKGINPAFMGTISFALGTVIFICWFLLISIAAGTILTWWAGLLAFVFQYGLGQFTLSYWMAGRRFLNRVRYEKALKNSPEVQQLEKERLSLVDELDGYRKRFEKIR